MSLPKEKRQKIYYVLNAETKPKFICRQYTKQRRFFYKEFLKEKGNGVLEQKTKRGLFNCSCYED